jgi:hypothetical protein
MKAVKLIAVFLAVLTGICLLIMPPGFALMVPVGFIAIVGAMMATSWIAVYLNRTLVQALRDNGFFENRLVKAAGLVLAVIIGVSIVINFMFSYGIFDR